MSHPLAAFIETVRTVFARESLPPPPAEPARRPRRGLANLLFSAEPLPVLPEPPAATRARRGILALLFAPEPLAVEPELPPRRHTPWLRWLLLPERIEREPNHTEVN